MRRKPLELLLAILVVLSPCSALRFLQQSAEYTRDLSTQAPAAQPVRSDIQLSAPGNSKLLNAPAFAPASESLPAGVVSLAAKRNSNGAATANGQDDQQSFTYTTMPATNGTGEFSVIKANDNSGKGLPGGTVNKKLSAAQLAATQQAIKQANTAAAANQTGPIVLGTGDGYTQILIHPTDMQKMTVDKVNSNAPVYSIPGSVNVKPQLATGSGLLAQQSEAGQPGSPVAPGQQITAAQADASTASNGGTTTVNVGGKTINIIVPTSGNPEQATGSYLAGIAGVRISTPLFGTGFNFCIDRYFGSFPKVGIIIPNAAAWLLPEFQDVANALEHTLDLPSILPHGARVDPTADGFLLQLPTFQPSQLPEFGIRYGIQIGQAFGYDFGLGIVKDLCFVSFVIV